MTRERASIFGDDEGLDVSAFTTKPRGAVRPDAGAVRQVAERAGFPSREPAAAAADRPRRAAPRTGRNLQLNLKVSRDYLDRFLAYADQLGVSQAEALEYLIRAGEQYMEDR